MSGVIESCHEMLKSRKRKKSESDKVVKCQSHSVDSLMSSGIRYESEDPTEGPHWVVKKKRKAATWSKTKLAKFYNEFTGTQDGAVFAVAGSKWLKKGDKHDLEIGCTKKVPRREDVEDLKPFWQNK
jgi:hypothetical protein